MGSEMCIRDRKQTVGIRLSAKAEKSGTDKAEIGVVAYAIRD